ncbi:hypothetical protein HDK64DRAFT_307113 [Phyllosticta capitalensis]
MDDAMSNIAAASPGNGAAPSAEPPNIAIMNGLCGDVSEALFPLISIEFQEKYSRVMDVEMVRQICACMILNEFTNYREITIFVAWQQSMLPDYPSLAGRAAKEKKRKERHDHPKDESKLDDAKKLKGEDGQVVPVGDNGWADYCGPAEDESMKKKRGDLSLDDLATFARTLNWASLGDHWTDSKGQPVWIDKKEALLFRGIRRDMPLDDLKEAHMRAYRPGTLVESAPPPKPRERFEDMVPMKKITFRVLRRAIAERREEIDRKERKPMSNLDAEAKQLYRDTKTVMMKIRDARAARGRLLGWANDTDAIVDEVFRYRAERKLKADASV